MQFEESLFENPHWRKIPQMQPTMWLDASVICLGKGHFKIHSGEKFNKCKQCNFVSVQARSLKRHTRTHTGERSYNCTTCDFSSVRESTLRTHIRTHTGERPYKCNQCDFPFSLSTDVEGGLTHVKKIQIL